MLRSLALLLGLAACGASPTVVHHTTHDVIYNDMDGALEEARARGALLLVNFTSPTCAEACRAEREVLDHPDHAELFSGLLEARLMADNVSRGLAAEHHEWQMDLIGRRGIPAYVVLDPVTREAVAAPHGETLDPAGFALFLERSRASAESRQH